MTTLFLNLPQGQVNDEGKRSYAETLEFSVGNGYAIPKGKAEQCLPGCAVVILCRDGRQRAEGRLKALKETGTKAGNGILRYDVEIESLAEVPYLPQSAPFGRTGVLVVVLE